jgi:tetratricopeptide (TPR) repeat protein
MKRKKQKKISSLPTGKSSIDKTHSNNLLILSLTLLFSLLINNHVTNGVLNFKDDLGNPFYDIFYLYYNDEADKAKKMLRNLFRNREYRHHASINYGLILQNEKKPTNAREYLEKTFTEGERLSIIYLFNLYMNHYDSSYLDLLNLIDTRESSLWLEYEKGIYFLKTNKIEDAKKHLMKAVTMGFSSTDLLKNEKAFDQIRNTKEYTDLLKKVKKNKIITLREKLQKEELIYYRDKPSGVSKKLQIAFYFEKTKRYDMAEEILLSQISSKIPFRDKSIALYSISRIKAKRGDKRMAKRFINRFIDHLTSEEKDNTGYKKLMHYFHRDIIKNDRYLKNLLY